MQFVATKAQRTSLSLHIQYRARYSYLFIYFWFVLFCFGTKHLDPYQEFGITHMTFKSITLYRPIIILRGTDMCYAKYISYIQHE